jgi:hypothetical protein
MEEVEKENGHGEERKKIENVYYLSTLNCFNIFLVKTLEHSAVSYIKDLR